jgi:hypothetical protein
MRSLCGNLLAVPSRCGISIRSEIFGALRNARDPAQKWIGTFYFDPADIPAAEPVSDLSEPAIREDRF